ncbi:hypothetical protein M5K25_014711 [Dendrobium thyrsiflorum]|uniref:C2 domain-containing protein n=1 Tax=Dendrobium thyrsiflorum TaxID=117978 RepID=A0ABD0UVF5_DENTH
MAEGGGRKLVVEVSNARNLMPKDGQGTASAYVMVDFDGQRRRTKTKYRDLHPQWDEKLEFVVHDPEALASDNLELNVYNDKKNARRNTFLGKVKISGSSFAKLGDESLIYYPLEKRSVFSQVKGEIGLKVYYVDDDPPQPVDAPPADPQGPAVEKKTEATAEVTAEKPPEEDKKTEEKKEVDEPKKEDVKAEEKPPEEEKKQVLPVTALSSPARQPHHSHFRDLEIKLLASERAGVSYDLVDRVPYLFVRILKAKHAVQEANDDATLDRFVFAKIVIGSHTIKTRTLRLNSSDWDQVFSFHKESLNSTFLEISVHEEKKDGDAITEGASFGAVSFDLSEIPKRSPPDSPLAPQWYTLESSSPETEVITDVMLTIWVGTQADEAFPEAWQSDSGGLQVHTRSKAYLSPKLWYLRLTVIQTQDLRLATIPDSKSHNPELFVKAQLGSQVFKTAKIPLLSSSATGNPSWLEDLIFVATEPFDPFLTVSVEDASAGQPVGNAKLHLSTIHRRIDDRAEPPSRWLNLAGDEARPYAGRLHVRVCLEGGYHVLDETAHATSDVRAASKQLSKPPIGLLEVGVRGASNLVPIKLTKHGASGSTDAYAVLKYGQKWARTRTILDQFNPRWNEQYTWDVFDPCTVLTVAVFDNSRVSGAGNGKLVKDSCIGKVRVRLSTLDTNRVYLTSYPLTLLTPFGVKKMGELELAIRFTCTSWLSLIQSYTSPMLPRMHYVRPLGIAQQDVLRQTAARAVAGRLARSEPPLGPEVVLHVLDTDAYTWSMRRSKANWFRLVGCLSRAAAAARWIHGVRTWAQPTTTVLVHVLLLVAITWPGMIIPAVLMFMSAVVAWRYRRRTGWSGGPGGMDTWLSCVDRVSVDELDEEFDDVPSGRSAEVVRGRYDRLRVVAGRAQGLLGDLAAQGERVEALLTWRDPRATGIFVAACVAAAVMFYVVPFKLMVLGWGFYYFRHPRFRGDMPAAGFNFFRRLSSMADRIL